MPKAEAAASSGVTPTQGLPPEEGSPDPQATANVNTENLDGLIAELNEVREAASEIMAEDFKDFQGPTMIGMERRLTKERIERSERRSQLQQREVQISKKIREQTAATTYFA